MSFPPPALLDRRKARQEVRVRRRRLRDSPSMQTKFAPGQIVATPGALEAFERAGNSPLDFLQRHLAGDWGDVDAHDRQENEFSLEHGFRLLSVYWLSDGTKIWVITEADRSATTFLLPEEY